MILNKVSDARKNTIGREAAWELISSFKTIYAGKGKKVLKLKPEQDDKEKILKICLGRTGNLRSPTIQIDDTLYIGYNDNIYDTIS